MTREMTPTERWLCLWLNENATALSTANPLAAPVVVSFMVPALAKAIDDLVVKRFEDHGDDN